MVGGVCVTSPYKTGIKLGVTHVMVSESHGHTKINNGICLPSLTYLTRGG